MKYEKEYLETKDKKLFIKLLENKYKVKKATALRRWYDVYKIPIKKEEKKIHLTFEINDGLIGEHKPTPLKMLMLEDIKKFNRKVDNAFLKRYGFTYEEINWIIKNNVFR